MRFFSPPLLSPDRISHGVAWEAVLAANAPGPLPIRLQARSHSGFVAHCRGKRPWPRMPPNRCPFACKRAPTAASSPIAVGSGLGRECPRTVAHSLASTLPQRLRSPLPWEAALAANTPGPLLTRLQARSHSGFVAHCRGKRPWPRMPPDRCPFACKHAPTEAS